MAKVTGFTAERMLQIENSTVVAGTINSAGFLILTTRDGSSINAGNVAVTLPARLSADGSKTEDWNTVLDAGFHWSDGAANEPPGTDTKWSGYVLKGSIGDHIRQVLFHSDSVNTEMKTRVSVNRGIDWSTWQTIASGGGGGGATPQPDPPTGVTATPSARWSDTGKSVMDIYLTWPAVTEDVDGNPITVNQYGIWIYKASEGVGTAYQIAVVPGTSATLKGLDPADYMVAIGARSVDSMWSMVSDFYPVGTYLPTDDLPAANVGTLTTSPGFVYMPWDGLLASAPPPNNFRSVHAEKATTEAGPWADTGKELRSAGVVTIPGTPGQTIWVRWMTYSTSGAAKTPSTAKSIKVASISTSDLDDAINQSIVDAQNGATQAKEAADAASEVAQNASDAAAAAAGLAESKGKVLIQNTIPTEEDELAQNLWIDTGGGLNTPKRWDGTQWVAVTDKTAIDAAAAAVAAQTAADTAQGTASAAQAAADQAITDAAAAQSTADNARDTANSASTTATDAATAANAAQTAADQAATDAASAQSTASSAQTAADQAASDAATAAGLAASKADVLIQNETPVSAYRKDTTLWIDTTDGANTPKRWNGTEWAIVTDKAAVDAANAAATAQTTAENAASDAAAAQTAADAAQTAADAAQTTANDAHDTAVQAAADAYAAQQKATEAYNDAQTAQGTANNALTTANGKNKVVFSPNVASGTTGYSEGDIWFQRSGSLIVGQWEFTAGAWAARTLDSAVIASLDVGKLVAGSAEMDAAVIHKIFANEATVGELTTAAIQADLGGILDLSGNTVSITATNAYNLASNAHKELNQPNEPPIINRNGTTTWIDTTDGRNVRKRWTGDGIPGDSVSSIMDEDGRVVENFVLNPNTQGGVTYVAADTGASNLVLSEVEDEPGWQWTASADGVSQLIFGPFDLSFDEDAEIPDPIIVSLSANVYFPVATHAYINVRAFDSEATDLGLIEGLVEEIEDEGWNTITADSLTLPAGSTSVSIYVGLSDAVTATNYLADQIMGSLGDPVLGGYFDGDSIDGWWGVGAWVEAPDSQITDAYDTANTAQDVASSAQDAATSAQNTADQALYDVTEAAKVYTFGTDGLEIRDPSSDSTFKMSNSRISALVAGEEVSYWEAQRFNAPQLDTIGMTISGVSITEGPDGDGIVLRKA